MAWVLGLICLCEIKASSPVTDHFTLSSGLVQLTHTCMHVCTMYIVSASASATCVYACVYCAAGSLRVATNGSPGRHSWSLSEARVACASDVQALSQYSIIPLHYTLHMLYSASPPSSPTPLSGSVPVARMQCHISRHGMQQLDGAVDVGHNAA